MRNTFSLLLAGVALAVSAPALAEKSDKVVVDQYRQKIAAARADPAVARNGGADLDQAEMILPQLMKNLDDDNEDQVKSNITRIDTLIATARTKAQTAAAENRADAAAEAGRQQIAASEAEAARARAEADRARAQADRARAELAALKLKQTDLGATLVLQDVVFQTAKADLKPGAEARLQPLANYLRANPEVKVRVDGHTDAQGADAYNQQLSQARAASVSSALATMGIDRARIEAVGHGESEPVADNKTAAGRQQNRRVEVTLVGQQAGTATAAVQ